MKATGVFELNVQSKHNYNNHEPIELNHMWFDKVFEGALIAKSKCDMLGVLASINVNAGYVAIEQVTGTLHGRKGSFVLQHFSGQKTDRSQVLLQIAPGSGTHELAGLTGKMNVIYESGQHFYDLSYDLSV